MESFYASARIVVVGALLGLWAVWMLRLGQQRGWWFIASAIVLGALVGLGFNWACRKGWARWKGHREAQRS